MRYRVIQEHDRRYPIRLMCHVLTVSAAGYYAWRSRTESARAIQTRLLRSAIRVIHQESRETYGRPRIWDALVKQGHRIGEQRVARLMCQYGIRAKTVKKWRATTQSHHRFPVAANILDRGSSLYGRGSQSGVGGRPDLCLDPGGLALLGGAARSVFTPGSRVGHGSAVHGRAGRAGPYDGRGEPGPHGRARAPFGSRQSVCRDELPTSA
jgi:hypothetical protein